jgi:phosphatidylglycerophosphate synthase
MFDNRLRHWIDPPLARAATACRNVGIGADQVTWIGFGLGMVAAAAVASGHMTVALCFIVLNRLSDGLDGAIARQVGATDRGAFLDISLDFVFYAAIPLAFAFADPGHNALPAACLLAAIVANGGAFLAFSLLAAKRGMTTQAQGQKSIYYVAGLAEGGETIAAFSLACIFPEAFPIIASLFAALTAVSAGARIIAGWRGFEAEQTDQNADRHRSML